MKPFTFIHAADLHLGCAFKGVTARAPHFLELFQHSTYDAFQRLIQLCTEKNASFLLIAGDVFDDSNQSIRPQLIFRDGVAALAEKKIPTLIIHGNHDPKSAWLSRLTFPDGVFFFDSEAVQTHILKVEGIPTVAVSGISYAQRQETRRLAQAFKAEMRDLFQIGLLHTHCGHFTDHAPYAPSTLSELREIGMDYWALGHVHERAILSTSPPVVYPGNLQGLSMRETGSRGCYRVTVDEGGQPTLSFEPLDALRWFSTDMDVSGIETVDGLEEAVTLEIGHIQEQAEGRPAIARFRLIGRNPLYTTLRNPEFSETLLSRTQANGVEKIPPVWVEELQIDCLPEIDISHRRKLDDLLGQVLKDIDTLRSAISDGLGSPSGRLPEALHPALGELFRHRRFLNLMDSMTPDEWERMLAETERLCLGLLEPEE